MASDGSGWTEISSKVIKPATKQVGQDRELAVFSSFITFPESMAAKGQKDFSLSAGLSLQLMDSVPMDLLVVPFRNYSYLISFCSSEKPLSLGSFIVFKQSLPVSACFSL
ncbi:hypothetical protein ATANTOWER_002633 [Ataeniobius toweri]|uniref:Uncharacterized protein n=1 Tax=Ataeniobius toweri TaxID=208326 RepID=A0ABU7BG73_9TELE|nr:hypothetical protein [Ataeniobius toweri]